MIPAQRLQLETHAPRQFGAMLRLSQSVTLDPVLKELIDVRASQINGCAFCLDMHWKDAREHGESEERLYSLSTWQESNLYDERERAALALTEAMTRLAYADVADEVWGQATAVLDADELAQVVFAITAINAWNRLNVTARVEPGHYVPGMFG